MRGKIISGVIGFVLGVFTGGIVVGSIVGKRARSRVASAEERADQLIEERARTAPRALSGPLRGIVEAENDFDEIRERAAAAMRSYSGDEEVEEEVVVEEINPVENVELIDPDSEEDDLSAFVESLSPQDDEPEDVHLIPEEEFLRDMEVRQHTDYTYYQQEGLLTTSDGEVVYDQLDILGEDGMEVIDDTTQDWLYVADDINDELYRVEVNHHGTYMRDVMSSSL